MRYIPHTEQDIKEMLSAVGVESVAELFSSIPDNVRLAKSLDLPKPLSENQVIEHLGDLAWRNEGASLSCFAGGGSYKHHIPPILDQMLQRSEFYTAYTPYQAEISQGTLQAIYEFQTMITRLLGMDVSNASMYDGASALAEVALMSSRLTRKKKLLISDGVNLNYRQVVSTYTREQDFEFISIPLGEDGRTNLQDLAEKLNDDVAAVMIQSPNQFGVIEDLRNAGKIVAPSKAKYVVCFTEALAYGMLAGPGKFGADIVCGEGQSFGIPVSYGGPNLGLFTASEKNVRSMPGRICGRTVDANGAVGYVLTLATREQHIRRDRATSNICTNQALCALSACIYMSVLGAKGLPTLAKINHAKAQYLKEALKGAGAVIPYSAPTFNEFVFETKQDAEDVIHDMCHMGYLAGIPIVEEGKTSNRILVCATEMNSKQEIDDYVECIQEFL